MPPSQKPPSAVSTMSPPRPQAMAQMAPAYSTAPQVAPFEARPKPERLTTPLAKDVGPKPVCSAEIAEQISGALTEILAALAERAAGTPEEKHVNETEKRLAEVRDGAGKLSEGGAEALLALLKEVALKDDAAASAALAVLAKSYTEEFSSAAFTGLRFLLTLSKKLL